MKCNLTFATVTDLLSLSGPRLGVGPAGVAGDSESDSESESESDRDSETAADSKFTQSASATTACQSRQCFRRGTSRTVDALISISSVHALGILAHSDGLGLRPAGGVSSSQPTSRATASAKWAAQRRFRLLSSLTAILV